MLDDKGFIKTGPDLSQDDLAAAGWPLDAAAVSARNQPSRRVRGRRRARRQHQARRLRRRRGIDRGRLRPSGAAAVRDVNAGSGCASHRAITTVKQPRRHECEECVKIGSTWVHLRTCQECGGHALLRQLAQPARQQARACQRSPGDCVGGAGRALALLLPRRRLRRILTAGSCPETPLVVQSMTSSKTPAIGLGEFVGLMATLTALVALSIDMILPALPTIGAIARCRACER